MAKIWFRKEGKDGQRKSVGEMPLDWCVNNFGLAYGDWTGTSWPNIQSSISDPNIANIANYSLVIIEVEKTEIEKKENAKLPRWRTGFYFLKSKKPNQVTEILEKDKS